MKVEFERHLEYNEALFISAKEFSKAKKSKHEFDSLVIAVDAFSRLYGADHRISRDEYDTISDWLEGDGIVLFYVEDLFFMAQVINGNYARIIMYDDEIGTHLVRRPHVTKNSLNSVQKKSTL